MIYKHIDEEKKFLLHDYITYHHFAFDAFTPGNWTIDLNI